MRFLFATIATTPAQHNSNGFSELETQESERKITKPRKPLNPNPNPTKTFIQWCIVVRNFGKMRILCLGCDLLTLSFLEFWGNDSPKKEGLWTAFARFRTAAIADRQTAVDRQQKLKKIV
jgi:hypothetical protein